LTPVEGVALERSPALVRRWRDDRVAHAERIGHERPQRRLVVHARAFLQGMTEQAVAEVAVAELLSGVPLDTTPGDYRPIDPSNTVVGSSANMMAATRFHGR
jgi:hypothetical protein